MVQISRQEMPLRATANDIRMNPNHNGVIWVLRQGRLEHATEDSRSPEAEANGQIPGRLIHHQNEWVPRCSGVLIRIDFAEPLYTRGSDMTGPIALGLSD